MKIPPEKGKFYPNNFTAHKGTHKFDPEKIQVKKNS